MRFKRPLQEKLALFWYMLIPTGVAKTDHYQNENRRIHEFKEIGMGKFEDILLATAKSPGMLFYLDNIENTATAVNENWGRELLELFSMGVGNYTEDDIKECAKAFTGWSIGNVEYMMERSSRGGDWPYGKIAYHYEFKDDDNDKDNKKFLGHLPIHQDLRSSADKGDPLTRSDPNHEVSLLFKNIAEKIKQSFR